MSRVEARLITLLSVDHFTAEEIGRFKTDEEFYRRFRAVMENDMNVRAFPAVKVGLFSLLTNTHAPVARSRCMPPLSGAPACRSRPQNSSRPT